MNWLSHWFGWNAMAWVTRCTVTVQHGCPVAHGVSIVRSQKEGVCHPEERKESLGLTSKLSGEEVNFSLNLQIEYHGVITFRPQVRQYALPSWSASGFLMFWCCSSTSIFHWHQRAKLFSANGRKMNVLSILKGFSLNQGDKEGTKCS